MKAPICRVCGIAHWGATHVWPGTLRTGIPKPPPSTPAVEAQRYKPQLSGTLITKEIRPGVRESYIDPSTVAFNEASLEDALVKIATDPKGAGINDVKLIAPPGKRVEATLTPVAPRKRSIASKRSAPPISKPEPPADIEPPEPAPADETPEQRKRRYHREYMRSRREKKAKGR